ncbi:hypothetical protein SAMN05444745_11141 [Arthrobacter sp. OV608]|nr:hypothetical protein SAMN05444745_11141 [Arthrobacter sp. OV608]
MLCPRWDSNYLPALVKTGNLREHAESEAVQPICDLLHGESVDIVHTLIGPEMGPTGGPARPPRYA